MMSELKQRLNDIVQYAIDTDYEIYDRQTKIREAMYSKKNICLFGLGEFFRDCATEEHFARFEYVSDNNPECWGKYYKGRLCVSPKEIHNIEDCIVIIIVGEWRPIYKQLTDMGIECYPMDWYSLNVYDKHYTREWFEERRETIVETVDLFEDDESKEVYVEALANRIAPPLATKIFNEIKIPGEYFEAGVFELSDDEYLVDAGAYKGDSVEKFANAVNNRFGGIYSFELDGNIFAELEENVKNFNSNKIHLFKAGVGDKNDWIEYGYVEGKEKKKAQIVRLDDALKDRLVTLIKMDVETAEIPALRGAKHIIQTQKPKLAISAYHYLSDLWEVPRCIKDLEQSYKIFLRHHAPAVWDTDCYAYVEE